MGFKQGLFNRETMEVTFGGPLSVDKNRFVAQAIKVPDFVYTTKETADAGGGWHYGYKEEVTRTERNAYIVVHDNKILGWMNPYRDMKSDLYPLDWKYTRKPIRDFAQTLNLHTP